VFDILLGALGVFIHPIETFRGWWDTLFKHDDTAPDHDNVG
jgi:hypothetical protein